MHLALQLLADDEDPFGIIIACFFLVVLVGFGAYAVIWLRRRYWGSEGDEVPHVGFTLGDLRHLHKSGKISQEEFERAKVKIVEAAKRAAERQAQPAKPPRKTLPRNQQPGGQ
jgi:hypothetical protein